MRRWLEPLSGKADTPRGRSALRGWQALAVGVIVALTLGGCQIGIRSPGNPAVVVEPQAGAGTGVAKPAETGKAVEAQAPSQAYTAKLEVKPARAEVGARVQVAGSGYPAGAEVELVWYTVEGRFELEGGTEFVGERFDQVSRVLTTVRADQTGSISASFDVPVDFGGAHDLRGRVGDKELSQAAVTINPTFSMMPREGPVGTPIEFKIVGVDWRSNVNTWHVLYDNRYLGFVSAVQTKGVAVARFRASGPVGEHAVSIWHNSFNPIPYLNWQQGPYKDVPGAEYKFKVTRDAGAPPALVEDFKATDNPWPVTVQAPGKLQLSPDRGAVGQSTTLRASGLPANTELTMRWWTMVGNRVSSTGFTEESRDLGKVRSNADGTLVKEMPIPDDLGGQHRLELVADGKVQAAAGVVILPSVLSSGPTKVRAGEEIKIHLKGVGWTTYDNTYAVTYDNSYIGYVCGFSTNGDVQFTITATGAPGTHLIDLYPTVYKGKDAMPRIYSVPQLTYAEDHPQRITPAIRLAIEIAE